MASQYDYSEYFKELDSKLEKLYKIAKEAKKKGLDASKNPGPKITRDIAERVETMVGPPGIKKRMQELVGMDRRDMAFKVAEEIALGRYSTLERQQAADQAIRTSLAIMTEGVTVAPWEGIPKIAIKQNPDRSSYLSLYFAGPIRPAGGTAQALTVVVADHVRIKLGLERYQPTENAIQRFIEEVRVYERNVRRFQYHVSDEDLESALHNIPVEVTGVATDQFEVSNYRDVPGIETNRLRGGALIVVVDGIVGRARKLYGACEKLGMPGWEFLNKLGKKQTNSDGESSAAFMEEIIVGRPVFSFPGAQGGFRLRYGRARNTGLAAVGIHPATMIILNKFLTTGVQMRTELPGKSAAICPVDSIEPPIVLLKNGSVIEVSSDTLAEQILPEIKNILYLGDYLSNVGDFIQNNKALLPAGYDEQQWILDLERACHLIGEEAVSSLTGLLNERIRWLKSSQSNIPSAKEVLALTNIDVPIHPKYNFHWSSLNQDELIILRNALLEENISEKPTFSNRPELKSLLERTLITHTINEGKIDLGENTEVVSRCLCLENRYKEIKGENIIAIISNLSGFTIREKAPVFVGARMGRPEKAKERRMEPYVHCLYPVGESGGPQRDIIKTGKGIMTQIELSQRRCNQCSTQTSNTICPSCGEETSPVKHCSRCGVIYDGDKCPNCKGMIISYNQIALDLRAELEDARKYIGGQLPERIKCVKKLMNETRTPEHLSKGILRARYDLSVFKDGTLRYDLTNIPLTHFTPFEIGITIEKTRELGYTHDMNGNLLENVHQMIELQVQDIILPEECGDYLVKVAKFLNEELRDFYKLEPFYNIKQRKDVIGHLLLGLAPHTSATIVGRLIGFTKVRNCYAHPLWHAAKRRNCDGDEDAIMLALDPLLNFSEVYLPEQSGGKMDAPLYIIPTLNPSEVDKEAHNLDVNSLYPREFYKLCNKGAQSSEYSELIDTIGLRLGSDAELHGFSYTMDCSDINMGSHLGAYTSLSTMVEKLDYQLELASKLRAVDSREVALKILNSHFMKDIVGNLRAFTSQTFRCTKCNRKYRRPPLSGNCLRCNGPIQMTVHRGGIEKYLDPALQMVIKYDLGQYYKDRLELVKEEIRELFIDDVQEETTSKQFSLIDFMRSSNQKSKQ